MSGSLGREARTASRMRATTRSTIRVDSSASPWLPPAPISPALSLPFAARAAAQPS